MALIDLQRQVVEACLGREPTDEQLAPLGDARIWLIYREAIRKRLRGELDFAFPRTRAAAGEALFTRAFERFLQEEPPRVRFFHAVPAAFARGAAEFFAGQAEIAAYVPDLCCYEAALRTVADLPDEPAAIAVELDFGKRPLLSPALRLLALRHAVHDESSASRGYDAGEHFVCIHRRPDERRARALRLNAVGYALMRRFDESSETISDSIAAVAAERAIHVDERFIDGLCTMLADLIEKGVILGARG